MAQRNATKATVHWQLTLAKARVKLDRHYQKIRVTTSPDYALASYAAHYFLALELTLQ